jgi:ADP-ribosylglycohydrolase/very-short-patch-repair endonuclease
MSQVVERLQSLIEFAKQSALLRATPPQSIGQHKQFSRLEDKMRALPGLHLNVQEVEFDEVWLRLDRLHETRPAAPESKSLALWIELSNSPQVEPKLRAQAERSRLVEIGAIPENKPEDGTLIPTAISLDDFLGKESLLKQFQSYVEVVWRKWAAEEKERRRSISLYGELFMLSQQMQGNLIDSQIELVWGVGIGVWGLPTGAISYPLLSQLVEISLNETDMSLEIRPRSSEPRLEIDIYAAHDNAGVAKLVNAAKEFFGKTEAGISPFEPSTFEGLLRSAATFLDSQGVYWPDESIPDDRTLPKAGEHLVVTDTWALFARPRTSSLFVQDLERFEKALTDGSVVLPNAVSAMVTDPSDTSEESSLPSFRGLSLVGGSGGASSAPPKELYFPMAYNDEQVQIVQNLEAHDGVVVQGPPGTGKTHTIANVICHYLAQGKRVLVTSMKDPALAVLQEKIPADIRPLAISLLTSEAEGMKQFEFAINKISAEVQRIDRSAYRQEISQIDGRIDGLHAKISRTDRDIAGWASKNLDQISVDGNKLSPAAAAKEVALNRSEIEWFADKISIIDDHHAQFSSADIIDLRKARLDLGNDLAYLGQRVPQLSDFPESQKLLQVHQDLSRFSELKEKEATGQVPPLIDGAEETFHAALGLAARVSNLRLRLQELRNVNQPWISSLRAYLKHAGRNEILDLFVTLKSDIDTALRQRKEFISRPVSLPADLDKNDELVHAISNMAEGVRPFGLAGIIGKGEQKKLLDSVLVINDKPKSPLDWTHVQKYIADQKLGRGLLTRWNALAVELPLPRFEISPDRLSGAGLALELFDKVQASISEESSVTDDLKRLMPAWKRVELLAQDAKILDEAESNLTHHLIRHRLAQTWVIKESFLKALSGCSGAISDQLREFLNTRLGNKGLADATIQADWSALMEELRRVLAFADHLKSVVRVTASIEASGAPLWADNLRRKAHSGAHDSMLPDNWQEVWRLRRLTTYLDSIDARQDLKRLSKERTELENDLAKQYRDAVTRRTWLKLSENATDSVRSALEAYRSAVRKIGKGTGVRAVRYRQDARVAADRANSAIPCWIMPHYRVCESLPPSFGCFDLVIIDEASQSDLTALPSILRAKKVLIVGDDKQVSPEGVGLEEEKIRNLMGRFLGNQVEIYRAQMTPERSIYDLFKVVFAKSSVMLREHFRCVAPIIEYSKREFYNHELRPLRLPKVSERLDPPLVDVYVEDGYRNSDHNPAEARFIVDEIRRITSDASLDRRTIGVVSLVGNEQALRIMQMLNEELGAEIVTRFHITCGDARTFQGKERDIMFLSMVVAPGRVQAQTHEMFSQRFNVAASRARDRMYLVRSVTLDDLSPADLLRSRLIQHFQTPFSQDPEESADLRMRCESPFEREVFDVLVERGYRVIPQVPVGAYRIDMVVEGDNDSRLAIECDGDQYHGPGQWDSDMRRQRILERAGWQFWRCFASTFVLQREAVITDLAETLGFHGVNPTSADSQVKSIHSEQRRVRAFEQSALPVEPEYSKDFQTAISEPKIVIPITSDQPETFDTAINSPSVTPPVELEPLSAGKPIPSPTESLKGLLSERKNADLSVPISTTDRDNLDQQFHATETDPNSSFVAYVAFNGRAGGDPRTVSEGEVAEGLCRIVEVEGPMVAKRAYDIYLRSCGIKRMGHDLKSTMTKALTNAIRQKRVVSEDESGTQEFLFSVIRMKGCPPIKVRSRGPRDFEEIPPSELFVVARRLEGQHKFKAGSDEHLRAILECFDLKRLTTTVGTTLLETLEKSFSYADELISFGSLTRVSGDGRAKLLNVARGAVIGALAGDAAGATLEFLGRKPTGTEVEVAMRMVGGGIWKTAPGQVTDDGELTLALAHALAGESLYDPRRAAHSYRRWFLSQPFDVGAATTSALGFGDQNSPTLADLVMTNAQLHNMESKANGSLMRASILGIWSSKLTIEDAVDAARRDAQLTHPNPSCQWAGAAYVIAIRHLMLHPGDAQGAFDAAELVASVPGAEEVRGWIEDARRGVLPECYPLAGFVRIAFTRAFYHLVEQASYEAAIFKTLAAGGDTDTNACIVGGLIGALHGALEIPEIMCKSVLNCDTQLGRPRPSWLHTTQVDDLITRVLN